MRGSSPRESFNRRGDLDVSRIRPRVSSLAGNSESANNRVKMPGDACSMYRGKKEGTYTGREEAEARAECRS